MENPNINLLTGTVSFSRKISVRQYESAEASVFIQFPIPTEGDADEIRSQTLSNARAAMFEAKGLVLEELGLEFQVDENGVLHELITKNLGNVTEIRQVAGTDNTPVNPNPIDATPTSDSAPYSADTQDKGERAANKSWAVARWNSHPHEFWDNRANKRNPKGPDLKHKDTGLAVWL